MNEKSTKHLLTLFISLFFLSSCLSDSQKEIPINPDIVEGGIQNFDSDTESVSLYHYLAQSDYTLVEFWGEWCPNCTQKTNELKALYTQYSRAQFNIIGVPNIPKDGMNKYQNYIVKNKLEWPQFTQSAPQLFKEYKVRGIPTFFLVQADGKILLTTYDLKEITDFLSKAL